MQHCSPLFGYMPHCRDLLYVSDNESYGKNKETEFCRRINTFLGRPKLRTVVSVQFANPAYGEDGGLSFLFL